MNKDKSPFFISVVVPIEKFEISAREKLLSIQESLDKSYWDYEILLVASRSVYKKYSSELNSFLDTVPATRYIQLSSNLSREVSLECGAENSIGDFVVLFELDTDPISIIKEGVEKCAQGTDVLVGTSRFENSPLYGLGRRLVKFLLNLSEYKLPKDATDFRVLSRRAVNAVFSSGKRSQDFFMRIQNSGFEWKSFPYKSERIVRKTFSQGLKKTLDLMVFNSLNPLRAISLLGLLGSLFACIFALYSLVIQFFKSNVVEGWTSIVLLLSFFFLLQFVILSFISQYLARLLRDLNRESDYAVVFEKNSRVMVNRDRINVLEEEESKETNLVQTGRNK